jgi:hypothetical protein
MAEEALISELMCRPQRFAGYHCKTKSWQLASDEMLAARSWFI